MLGASRTDVFAAVIKEAKPMQIPAQLRRAHPVAVLAVVGCGIFIVTPWVARAFGGVSAEAHETAAADKAPSTALRPTTGAVPMPQTSATGLPSVMPESLTAMAPRAVVTPGGGGSATTPQSSASSTPSSGNSTPHSSHNGLPTPSAGSSDHINKQGNQPLRDGGSERAAAIGGNRPAMPAAAPANRYVPQQGYQASAARPVAPAPRAYVFQNFGGAAGGFHAGGFHGGGFGGRRR
jgi:hypothetical protein